MAFNNFILFFTFFYFVKADFWPEARQNITLIETKIIDGVFDCEYDRYIPDPKKMGNGGQSENQKRVFDLNDGATISNCIIGVKPGAIGPADGIRCLGSCTINNVWFETVGEDAITFYGKSGNPVYHVNGGGARHGKDKTFQFDGKGTTYIDNYYVDDYVRLLRCCGNCPNQFQRNVVIRNLTAINGTPGQFIVGINKNYGDTAKLSQIKMENGVHPCKLFTGNNNGAEPQSIGTEEDGKYCIYNEGDITYLSTTSSKKKKKSGK
uniref:Probable pectate lyase F n=1 Tax=Meloidogyne graminicola TaxID=189291 RepID=A0A0H3U5M6_9BILA|nr:pectate lyase [Meloidogyne graminicola]QQM16718.1 pectate lyase [Meloidogyne graminicola]